jgi:predicted permease
VRFARLGATWQEFIDRVSVLPGIRAAAGATMIPLTGRDRGVVMAITGVPKRPGQDRGIHVNEITDRYFDVVGIGLISGREFNPRDRSGSPRVAILNQTAARAFFGFGSPIGRRVSFPGQWVEDEYEIVGVARDAQYENLRTPDGRMVYLPIEQSVDPVTDIMAAATGAGDVTRLVSPIREVVKAVVPGGFVTGIETIDQRIRASLVRERLLSMLATFFGALALVLASIGLYGVMAYSVVRRMREIGIRLAVGASRRAVIWIVIRDLLIVVLLGAALGVVSALNAGRYLESQLFAVAAVDPVSVFAAILLLLGMTAAAAYVPARRASLIDPAIALRYE